MYSTKKHSYLKPECSEWELEMETMIAQSASLEGFDDLEDYTLS